MVDTRVSGSDENGNLVGSRVVATASGDGSYIGGASYDSVGGFHSVSDAQSNNGYADGRAELGPPGNWRG
ncbi:hypothetical protein NEOLI_002618 [Neolecta irregularis DAH-3]|uniref:Uncharacterized protein n=1 Tax=Neolecta irregularis (strain DAH-3) TaxID=1198029 RepID=A0A1U7LHE0_NEOID|nr:hypothetical protein NEOLI_002618 [Neolecta irregularis DAH-3]|eukprot:OLL22013.1 hypothetical protein NEOLI_002618 [Neolecta irregularis DAH-3]